MGGKGQGKFSFDVPYLHFITEVGDVDVNKRNLMGKHPAPRIRMVEDTASAELKKTKLRQEKHCGPTPNICG